MPNIETLLLGLKPFFGVLLFFVVLLTLQKLFQFSRYKNSNYGVVSGNGFWRTILDKGNYGEYLTFRILEKLKGNNKLLTNVYIPKADGTTTEIDLLLICRAGFYVFESKNYSGWIFGDEKSKNWTTSLKGGKKIQFLSPVIQNNGHINALRKFLGETGSTFFYSFIVFSERCELKKVMVTTPDVFVVKRDMLIQAIRKDMGKRAEVLTDAQINAFYEILQKHSLADAKTKEQHIQNIIDVKQKAATTPLNPTVTIEPVIYETSQTNDKCLDEVTRTLQPDSNIENAPIFRNLKQYRSDTSKTEGIQAYNIFNNAQMLAVIAAMPRTLADLKKISGFGEVKCQKYGEAILEIVRLSSQEEND